VALASGSRRGGVAREATEPISEVVRRPCLDQKAVLAVAHDVRNPADPRRDHGLAGRKRLDRRNRRSLVRGRQDEDVERGEEARHLLLVAEEERLAHHSELVGAPLDLVAVRAVADEAEPRVDAALA